MSDKKTYNEACINEVIQLIKNEEIDLKDFNRIETAVKNHFNYEYDQFEAEWEDVIDYVSYRLDYGERLSLLRELGIREEEEVEEEFIKSMGINTLDGKYRFELLMKLFKASYSETELESWIKPEILEKIKYVQADV